MSEHVVWMPQPGPQTAFVRCPYEEVLYGGAAGGGKSDALIGDFGSGIERWGSAWHGLIARRTFPQLAEIEKRCLEIFSPHYGQASYKRSTHTWHFQTDNGESTLKLAAIDDEIKVIDHQGQQYSYVGIDEATQWPTDGVLEYLVTRTRSPKGSPTYFRLTANPGGVGHEWVKSRFRIGQVAPMEPFEVEGPAREGVVPMIKRVFIPARVTDNLILMKNDPTYIDKLNGIADPTLRRALFEGDWDVVAGAAFPEFSREHHVVKPFDTHGMSVVRGLDWGFEKPFACLWQITDNNGVTFIIKELYGSGSKPGLGNRMAPEQVWERIQAIEKDMGWAVSQAWLDPQCWADHGRGVSEFQLLGGPKARWRPWPKGKNSRRQHKLMVHEMLKVVNGESNTRFFDDCYHTIRTFGTLPIDQRNIEDVDTHAEDHAYDAFRGMNAKRAKFNKLRKTGQELDFFDNMLVSTAPTRRGYGGW